MKIKTVSLKEVVSIVSQDVMINSPSRGMSGIRIFTGKDRNGREITVFRDSKDTVRVNEIFPGWMRYRNVPFQNIQIVLGEMCFKTESSVWYESPDHDPDSDPEPGYIYILNMRGTSYYKIGKSKDYQRRQSQLGILMPTKTDTVAVYKTNKMTESEEWAHSLVCQYNTNGEWFELNESALENLIDGIAEDRVI